MSSSDKTGRLGWVLQILGFVAVVVADALGLVPLTQTIVLVPLIWLLLKVRRERWASIGWTWPARPLRGIVIGVVAGVLLELLAVHLTTPWISSWFGVEPDYSEFQRIQGNVRLLLLFVALSWVIAAFGEEICFRGFLMKRLAQLGGEGRWAWIVALILSSALFGWGHTEQGPAGWVQEGCSGFLLGVLFLANGKQLLVPIVAHGTSNTLAFVLIYFGTYPGLGQ